jgi:hypothetical protein
MPSSAVKETVRFVPSRRPTGSSDLRHPAPLGCFTWNRAGARGVAPEHLDAPARHVSRGTAGVMRWPRARRSKRLHRPPQGVRRTPAPLCQRGLPQVGTIANHRGFHVELRSTALRDLPPGPPSTAGARKSGPLCPSVRRVGARRRRVRAEGVGEPVAPSLRWAGGLVATETRGTHVP